VLEDTKEGEEVGKNKKGKSVGGKKILRLFTH
jgi:hypothetical protein